MAQTISSGWNRREFFGAAWLLALAIGLPSAGAALSSLDDRDAPTDRQRQMMRHVADAVIPRTDTASAGDVGAGDFAILALAHGLEGTRDVAASGVVGADLPGAARPDGSLDFVRWLEMTLDRAAGGDWLNLPPQARIDILTKLDGESFPPGPPPENPSPWRAIKGLVLTGYYTSETGGSEELRFDLVPGRYEGDIPLSPDDRAWSSDWTAVEFG